MVGDPSLELSPFLGAEPSELLKLHYGDRKGAVFSADKLFDEGAGAGAGFLTTAALAGILDHARIPFDLVGESELESDRPIPRLKADAIAVGISTTHLFDAPSVAAMVGHVRRRLPDVPIVLGGAGTTLNPWWFDVSGADYQVVGDGEHALPELIHRLRAGADIGGAPNLRLRCDGQVQGKGNEHYVNLDEIPLPRPDLVSADGEWPMATFYESRRGCPYKCAFCSYPNQSPKSRHKSTPRKCLRHSHPQGSSKVAKPHLLESAERMVEEFGFYASKGIRFLACHDSSMLTPRPRMRRFTSMLIERDSRLLWGCWGYPNELDLDLLQDMFCAGCRYVAVGVESADEAVLQSMLRPASTLALAEGLANVKHAGMILSIQLLVGFPGETEATIAATMQFLAQSAPDFYSAQPFKVRDSAAPAVRDPARFGLAISRDAAGRAIGWSHSSMNSRRAEAHVREMQTRIALDCERPFYHGLLRAGSSIGILPPVDAHGVALFRGHVLPILKEWERALVFHERSSLGNVDPDRQRFQQHRSRARRLLDEALEGGAFVARSPEPWSMPSEGPGRFAAPCVVANSLCGRATRLVGA